jgi:GNAT superfamily N-acetyltransferase
VTHSFIAIEPFDEKDFAEVVEEWHTTNRVTYTYSAEHQRHELAGAQAFFRDVVLKTCAVLVARRSGTLVGVMALEVPWIRQLAVFPRYQRQGVGRALLAQARTLSPHELRLFTFQRNVVARSFYEAHGFVAVAFGISPAPECEPDVEYRWAA